MMWQAGSGRTRRRNVWLAGAAAFVLLLGLLWQRCGVGGCPNVGRLTSYQPGGATVLLDAAGEPFADLAPIGHSVIHLDSLPDHVPAAFVAVEDKRFFQHRGVDYRRVVGALAADLKARAFVQGFSTITMQLARNVWPDRLPGRNRTIRRKVLEIRVARDIEERYTKEEILELYLNHIYFGGGAYGIDAASRHYFRKPASDLTLAEAALLAAMPKSPTLYNPRRFAERARARRDLVLTLMAEQGAAEADAAAAAKASPLGVRSEPPPPRGEVGAAPYFAEAVRRVLENRLGEDVYTSPLRVHTTLDIDAQRAAEQRMAQQLRALESGAFGKYEGERYREGAAPDDTPEYIQGAFVLMEAATGNVRALIGGRDYEHSRFNRATQARRQVGSAFKPFVYAAALVDGYAPSQLVSDSVLRMELPRGEVWEPRNFGGENEGMVTLRDALVRSKNVPTIRLAADVGLGDVTRLARRAGIRSELSTVPSAAIGIAALTPLELTASYSAFARLGTAVNPRFITRIEDAAGEVVWEPEVLQREVMDSAVAYLVTDMLREAVRRGTAESVRRAGYQGTAAGKTGTTNDGMDVWFVGYTPTHVATVWIGFDRPRPVTGDASGGRIAAPVWARIMRTVDPDPPAWPRPSGVVEHEIDPATGAVLTPGCRPRSGSAGRELFVRGDEPARVCPEGEPTAVKRGVIRRTGSWFGRQWRRFTHWVTRHFGSEERQRAPREQDYLGTPRLPRAAEVSAPELNVDSLMKVELPLVDTLRIDSLPGVLLPLDTIPLDTLVARLRGRDSLRDTLRDTTRLPREDTLRVPRRDTLRVPRRDTLPDFRR